MATRQYTFLPRAMPEDMAAYYVGGLAVTTFRKAMKDAGVEPVQLSTKRIGYLREDLDAWLDARAGRGPSSKGIDLEAELAKYG